MTHRSYRIAPALLALALLIAALPAPALPPALAPLAPAPALAQGAAELLSLDSSWPPP